MTRAHRRTLARGVLALFGIGVALVFLAMLAGCATAYEPSRFERCVDTVAGESVVITHRIQAAEWCSKKGAP